ncbi:ATP-binding protein [Leifsonia sp. YAF41]|uniref:ATP-binding protein n=1 Tax=Leifsonia sp. YAF41 TaxID=3233086 RepID=UPI003F9E8969
MEHSAVLTAFQPGPVATADSLDGRHFQFAGAADDSANSGDFVTIHSPGSPVRVGQIEDVTLTMGSAPYGSGRVIGQLKADGRLDTRTFSRFSAAEVRPADPGTLDRFYPESVPTVGIGTVMAAGDVSARLLSRRFNRHTFWCGQSGSGKTYALGVVLEQLLIHTELPMVIFDPNADFVRLRELRHIGGADAESDGQKALTERTIRVLRPDLDDHDPLRVKFTDLPLRGRAAVFRLDPLADREEYNELARLEETVGSLSPEMIAPKLRASNSAAAHALADRIENLSLTDWDVWAGGKAAVTDIIDSRPDATVLDLGGFTYPDEPLLVAMAVLDDLWAKREQRRPILIVIDEAHNFCSPEQNSPLHTAVRDRIIQIAAEGRKFGLWLLLSTQRPSRVHSSIVSQCDNLVLMKMSSPVDLDELATIFGFVPAAMLARSPRFLQGEGLFAGGFVLAPTMVTMGGRLTEEGGADVDVPLRAR